MYVHRLVAETFLENPENKKTVNHKDGNKLNCCIENLEYATYSENNMHAYNIGLKKRGSAFYNSKLTESAVIDIKKNGKVDTYENIAKKYKYSKATIRDILIGNTWKTVS